MRSMASSVKSCCAAPHIPAHSAPPVAVWPTCCSLRCACSSQADSKLNALLKLCTPCRWGCPCLPTEGLACACSETPCLPTWLPALQSSLPCGSASQSNTNVISTAACLQSPAFVGFSYSNTSRDARVGKWAGRYFSLHCIAPGHSCWAGAPSEFSQSRQSWKPVHVPPSLAGDARTARDARQFLLRWLDRFPQVRWFT